ncbi:hypothetical protein PM082_024210 [Marasmius tenuissimus]|nr:hypothetical protein PM082_024210 [Marasmius tenuissimus]
MLLVIPALTALAADVWGLLVAILEGERGVIDSSLAIFTLIALVGNLLLTIIIAGRIFFVAYRVGKYLPVCTSVPKVYRTTISATLESGLLYPVALIIYTACTLSGAHISSTVQLVAEAVFGSLVTIMGIASTLIIVRVSLGVAIHDEKSYKETIMRDIEPPQAQGQSSHGVVDLRRFDSPRTRRSVGTGGSQSDLEAQKEI